MITSSQLATATRHCAGALNHPERDRSRFDEGTAAHAVLQAVGNATNRQDRELSEAECRKVADKVCEKLIAEGRSYYGEQEPPLGPERVFAGRDLALEFLYYEPLEPGSRYEVGLACDESWHNCAAKAPQCAWRGTLDRLRVLEESDEDGYETTVLEVLDYKSAWAGRYSAKAWAAPSLQGKLYGCLALAYIDPQPTKLRLVGWNLRTRRAYVTEYPLPACLPEIEQWRSDLELLAGTLEKSKRSCSTCAGMGATEFWASGAGGEPVPVNSCPECGGAPLGYPYTTGAGCIGCPAALECPALAAMEPTKLDTPEGAADAYVKAKALVKALEPRVKGFVERGEPIKVEGGVVGFHLKDRRKVHPSAYSAIAKEWTAAGGDLRGFLAAAGLGVWSIDKLARTLHPSDMDARREWLAQHVETIQVGEFGIGKE